jgi:hypothetical protein
MFPWRSIRAFSKLSVTPWSAAILDGAHLWMSVPGDQNQESEDNERSAHMMFVERP